METIIKYAVVHELKKDQHKPIEQPNIRPNTLDLSVVAVNKLILGATNVYGKKNNSTHYGTFKTKKQTSEFPKDFAAYLKLKPTTEETFLEITQSAMSELHEAASQPQAHAASGGYILFVDYANSQGRFLLIAMLKKKDGLRLNENLIPEELIELDLNSLYQAVRISFKRFEEYEKANTEEKQELNYLSFLSQTSGRSAAAYFVSAIGCTKGTASRTATDSLIRESTNFFRERPDLFVHRLAVKDDILRYLTKQSESSEPAKLSDIERIARKYLPSDYEGQADDLAEELTNHLNSESVGVPVEFPVNKPTLEKHTHIVYKSENWQLKFDRSALGTADGDEIIYIERENKLIINNLPNEIKEIIKQELSDNTSKTEANSDSSKK